MLTATTTLRWHTTAKATETVTAMKSLAVAGLAVTEPRGAAGSGLLACGFEETCLLQRRTTVLPATDDDSTHLAPKGMRRRRDAVTATLMAGGGRLALIVDPVPPSLSHSGSRDVRVCGGHGCWGHTVSQPSLAPYLV